MEEFARVLTVFIRHELRTCRLIVKNVVLSVLYLCINGRYWHLKMSMHILQATLIDMLNRVLQHGIWCSVV